MVAMSSSSAVQMSNHGGNTTSAAAAGTPQDKLPSLFIERPKMPRATWDALRTHILRERQRKKQEQEQTQEVERMKKEREHKKKQEALTIEETKEEIANTEARLAQLKEEKHQLFHTLKKVIARPPTHASSVLYEDDRRRSKEVNHPQMYLQPSIRPNPNSHYMKPPPHLLMAQNTAAADNLAASQQAQKRARSPSPPRSNINSAYYRTPQGSTASKYGTYATSAVASVSASAIYGHTANPGPTSGPPYHFSADDRNSKPVYLTQAELAQVRQSVPTVSRPSYSSSLAVAVAERDRQVAAAAAQQRAAMVAAAASAPPAAHGAGSFRTGSIMSGYPRSVAYTVASPAGNAPSPRMVQAPQHSAPQQHIPPQQHNAPQGQQQQNGTVRYYTQREV